MGAMQELRERLESGEAASDVIASGQAPSSVYKALRQVRLDGVRPATAALARVRQEPMPAVRDRTANLEAQVARLQAQVADTEALRAELVVRPWTGYLTVDELLGVATWNASEHSLAELVHRLDTEAERCHSNYESAQKRATEAEAALAEEKAARAEAERRAEELGAKLKGLDAQLQRTNTAHASMSQSATQWQQKFKAEESAHAQAEYQWGLWCDNARQLEVENKALKETNAGLEPLRVWAGHPCRVCKRPLSGVVSREDAAKHMEDFAHKECLKKDSGPGFGTFLAGGAALLALSQLNKRPGT